MKGIANRLGIRLSAAAVAMVLGASAGYAQQQGASDQSRQQSQQQGGAAQRQGAQEQRQSGQQQGVQRQGAQQPSGSQQQRQAGNQQRQGDSELDQVVQQHPEIGTFVEALEQAGLVEERAGNTDYTIFAPTNQAFESMNQQVAELLRPENRQDLVALLCNHVVADDVDPQMARQLNQARTLDGDTISLSTEGETLMVEDASVVTPNIQVQEGNLRIYTIDKVLGQGAQTAAAGGSGRERG